MLNALQHRKVTRMFHVYDINRDGKLEEEDFVAVGQVYDHFRPVSDETVRRTLKQTASNRG